ncbi:fatty acid--CoA ligase [Pseudonocardia sp. TMWB2A]|uniref:AMP-binding protein n=1 Tax=Pseudonocardia sp. TMWB2A TaxID=687430 RepID=UPI00307E4C75
MVFTLRGLVEERRRERPDDVVVTEDGTDTTWRELHDRSVRIAAALVRDGVPPGGRVAHLGKNSSAWFPYLFGCALAGAVAAPLNWRLAPRELAEIIDDSGAEVVFVAPGMHRTADLVEEALGRGLTVVLLGGDHDGRPGLTSWWGPAEDPAVEPPDDVALELCTSGTTGRPKGVLFAGRTNLRVLIRDIAPRWGLTDGEVSLLAMPLFHMGGVAWALAGLAAGARGVVVRDFDAAAVLDTMERERVTTAFCVPTMLASLVTEARSTPRDLALRRMTYSGAPISTTALVAGMRTFGCDFVGIYGLTEATGAFAQLPPEDHDPEGSRSHLLRSAGKPYPWVEVAVVSPTDGHTCTVGEIGEILTRSEQNTVGYRTRAGVTSALDADGWLHTGDLGHLDADGRIFLVDRAKDLVISGGENVYPAEVENELAAHPDVAEVAVIGVPDPRWGETVKAIVVPRPGTRPDPAALITFARTRLAAFKCPTSVDVVDRLPRTATGKVIKGELREPYWRGHDRLVH